LDHIVHAKWYWLRIL